MVLSFKVNKMAGNLELIADIVVLSIGIFLGLGFVIYQYIKLAKEKKCLPKQSIAESVENR